MSDMQDYFNKHYLTPVLHHVASTTTSMEGVVIGVEYGKIVVQEETIKEMAIQEIKEQPFF